MTHRAGRHLLLSLFFLATFARAGTITQFTASYSLDYSWDVTGVDSQGDSVHLVSGIVFTGGGPCPCLGGQTLNLQLNASGLIPATLNGVSYNGQEDFSMHITGVLPPITMPGGWRGSITFPVTVDLAGLYYYPAIQDGILFTFSGSGTGTATAILSVLDLPNGQATYQNLGGFTFTSDAPEASSGLLAGLGLGLFAVLRLYLRSRGPGASLSGNRLR